MQFKPRLSKRGARSWAVIRWRYSLSKNRSLPRTIGTLTDVEIRTARQPRDLAVASLLNPDEQDELREFWRTARPAVMKEAYVRSLKSALADVDVLEEAIEADAATPETARILWSRIDRISAALRRAHLPRPKAAGHRSTSAS